MAEPTETVQGAVGAVNFGNIKTVGEAAAHSMALAMQNSVSHQKRMDVLAENFIAVAVKNAHELDPAEAVSQVKALTGNDIAATLANLIASLSSGQQQVKVAETTPPVTP